MIEKIYKMTSGDEKTVERIIEDENIHYAHIILGKDEGTPEHYTNSNLYMTVIRGKLSIRLAEQETNEYEAGTILRIPFNTKMSLNNLYNDILELTVVKVPAPK